MSFLNDCISISILLSNTTYFSVLIRVYNIFNFHQTQNPNHSHVCNVTTTFRYSNSKIVHIKKNSFKSMSTKKHNRRIHKN